MNRTIKLIFAIALALVMVLSLAACREASNEGTNKNELNSQFVGSWKSDEGETIKFFKDGSCLFQNELNYESADNHQVYTVYENGSIVFTYYGNGNGYPDYKTYSYEISDDSLTINGVKYKKQ